MDLEPIPDQIRASPEWLEAYTALQQDEHNLQLWEALVAVTELLRDLSSATCARVFDQFLARFPLLYAYWLKYAALYEPQEARTIYERAVAAFPISIDLWSSYLDHLTTHFSDQGQAIKAAFERATELAGRDFMSHPIWDRYLAFERNQDPSGASCQQILATVVQYPLYQYAQYFEMLDQKNDELFQAIQAKTNDRWAYESQITVPYFHVVPLEADQLQNWLQYLDYMESVEETNYGSEGFKQVRMVYERSLVAGALYPALWYRYARWMMEFVDAGSEEEVRNIFRRAVTQFIPESTPVLRFEWSLFEEAMGNYDQALDVLDGLQTKDAIVHRLDIHARRLANSQDLAALISDQLQSETHLLTRAILTAYKAKLDQSGLEQLETHFDVFGHVPYYSVTYFQLQLKSGSPDEIHKLWTRISKSTMPPQTIRDLSHSYMDFLTTSGDHKALQRYFEVDLQANGSFALQTHHQAKLQGQVEVPVEAAS